MTVFSRYPFLELGHQAPYPFIDRLNHRRHDGMLISGPASLLMFFDNVALGLQRHTCIMR